MSRIGGVVAIACALALVAAGCGGNDKKKQAAPSSTPQQTEQQAQGPPPPARGANGIVPAPAFSSTQLAAYAGDDWLSVHGDLLSTAHSSLKQITPANANQLGLAWATNLGGSCARDEACSGEGNALVYQGTYYIQTGADDVFALDAATGKRLWKHHAKFVKSFSEPGGVSRGMAMGDGRLYAPRIDGKVMALDMTTGKLDWQASLGGYKKGFKITAAPVYYDGMVVIGMSGGDNGNSDFVEAVDAKTGHKLWRWNAVPRPGEPGYKTWGDPNSWRHGGGAIWDSVSIDPKLDRVYVGTGNQVPWNTRKKGTELWADSIVSLDAHTGKLDWGYQTVHHDVWDDDIPASPVLYDAPYRPYKIVKPGRWVDHPNQGYHGSHAAGVKVQYTGPAQMQPALAVASKMGFVFILNRKTGKPLIPTPEMKVDQHNGKGLNLSPTQPIPVGDYFTAQCVLPSQWQGKGADGKPVKHGCAYTPVNTDQYVAIPHDEGEWMPSSYDPATHSLMTCSIDNRAWAMEALRPAVQKKQLKPGIAYTGLGLDQGKREGYTGGFTATNLATNEIAWRQSWKDFCYSGATTTAGGVSLTSRNNGDVRVIDTANGKTVWESDAPKGSPAANAPTITYAVDGKQYISVLAAGNAHESTKRGDVIYTYALGGNAQYPSDLFKHMKAPKKPHQKPTQHKRPSSPPSGASAQKTVNVNMYEFGFKLSGVPSSGKVTFVMKNTGKIVHNFDIQHVKAGPYVKPGKSKTMTVTLQPGKKYTYICDVPYHAQEGMRGTFKTK